MIKVQLIRGYKLYLWAKRLGISEAYAGTELDVTALYYVHSIIPVDELTSKVIVLTPISSEGGPRPIVFEAQNSKIHDLVETFEVEE